MKRSSVLGMILFAAALMAGCGSSSTTIQVATFTPSFPTDTPVPLSTRTLAPSETPPPATATPVDKPFGVTIRQMHMLDGPNGWAVGEIAGNPNDLILRTTDGGSSWRSFTPPDVLKDADPRGEMATAFFLSQYHAWVVYTPRAAAPDVVKAQVWHTADSGQTWEATDLPLEGMTMDFFAPAEIGFSDWQNGWIMAHLGTSMNHDYIAIFITQDGGASWKAVVDASNTALPSTGAKEGVTFLNAREGWVGGSYEGSNPGLMFWRTRDGGQTWQRQILPVPEGEASDLFVNEQNICSTTAPNFESPQTGTLIVTCTSYNFKQPRSWLYVTFDSGQTWNGRPLPGGAQGTLFFLTPYQGWYLVLANENSGQGYQIYYTENSGLNWLPITPVMWNGQLQFLTAQVGWGVVTLKDARAVVKTTNGGYTWTQLDTRILP